MSTAEPDPPPGWRRCLPGSPEYPVLLGQVRQPPALVVRGTLEPAAEMVAVVGARRLTAYGEEIAYQMGAHLAAAGVTVVSGMARGIDAAAHRGALDGGGRTVAVMGTGPDTVYPPEHRGLAERIAAGGALVTQFPARTRPLRQNFPSRNEVISGLSLGVVVVEARRQSGAMLTAGSAGSQGRTVMAVPGSVHNPASRGCHDLIRDGAALVTSAQEVLRLLHSDPMFQLVLPGVGRAARRGYGDTRDLVVSALEAGSLTLDEVVAAVAKPSAEVVTAVARLRLDEAVRLRDGSYGLATAPPNRNRSAGNRVV